MTSSPIIGIPCRGDTSAIYKKPVNSLNDAYIRAVLQAGGVPVLMPVLLGDQALRAVFDRVDGILLAGGGDIDPTCYQEAPHNTVSQVETVRDQLEILLARWAVSEHKPLFGICRGMQIMAIAAGGTLWQDISSQVAEARQQAYSHSNKGLPRNTLVHEIRLNSDSCLRQIIGADTFGVNSLHHQAIKDVPKQYQVVGYAPDGVIEALELPQHSFYCGVQWHPEEMVNDEESARRLFAAFVAAC